MPFCSFQDKFVSNKHNKQRRLKVERLQLILVILQIIEAILKLLRP